MRRFEADDYAQYYDGEYELPDSDDTSEYDESIMEPVVEIVKR